MRKSYKDVKAEKARRLKKGLLISAACLVVIAVFCFAAAKLMPDSAPDVPDASLLIDFDRKYSGLLDAFGETAAGELAYKPAADAGYAVFLSVSDGSKRAAVFTGTGSTIDSAWENARTQCREYVSDERCEARWLKADVVTGTTKVTQEELAGLLGSNRAQYFRCGLALDSKFSVALLEAEMNGARIYDYDNCAVDFDYLNSYLKKAGRAQVLSIPENLIVFTCSGWFADEDGEIYELMDSGLGCGRRETGTVDSEYALGIVTDCKDYLMAQVNSDGSFVYGRYPRFDKTISGYNFMRHAGTVWSFILQYRATGDEALVPVIDSTIAYMIDSAVVWADDTTAYLSEPDSSEIKLGGGAIVILALTDYMDVFGTDEYTELVQALGNGILTLLDTSTGEYTHVMNMDYTVKEEFRTVYYDGEATFALSRLYGFDGNEKWLTAACSAVDHFISADYTQYRDHWVAYAMNEITKYVPSEEYYTFALRNVQENLQFMYSRDTIYSTMLELLMVGFETYDRAVSEGVDVAYLDEVDTEFFMQTINQRVERMLDGFFFPEVAMYMKNPDSILNTFAVRHDGFRIRIDDIQHDCDGFYLYYINYDRLVEYGLLSCTN